MQYSGQIKEGRMHGRGSIVYPNNERYEGDWVMGKRHGFGTYHYLDGGRYEIVIWMDGWMGTDMLFCYFVPDDRFRLCLVVCALDSLLPGILEQQTIQHTHFCSSFSPLSGFVITSQANSCLSLQLSHRT